ncbi:hypothetical protein Trydic_g1231 [Trypoxylus dichotomus]
MGILDKKASERMQLIPNLMLSDCIFYPRQAEMEAKQNDILHRSSEINAIHHKKPQSRLTPGTSTSSPQRNNQPIPLAVTAD